MSLSGFIATIVITRTLGEAGYGTYAIFTALLSWIVVAGKLGLPRAIKKRVSEKNHGNFVIAGSLIQLGLYIAIVFCLILLLPYINKLTGTKFGWVLIVMVGGRLASDFIQSVLDGQQLVHISSLLGPTEWIMRAVIQVPLIIFGFGILGLLVGYVGGTIVGILLGGYFITTKISIPKKQDFKALYDFAQFSWLSTVKARTFHSMDTIVLAFFVTNSLVGIYEVAWNLASLFTVFSSAVGRTLFPELSMISSEKSDNKELIKLMEIGIAFTGLFIIPGLVGSALIGDAVLTIYGDNFDKGYYILLILCFARLIATYNGQFIGVLDALNKPNLTFKVNLVFVGVNLILNIVLTWLIGWYGAAIATVCSAAVALCLSYHLTTNIIDFKLPYDEIIKQLISSGLMACIVYLLMLFSNTSLVSIILLTIVGAATYIICLLIISKKFRRTVDDNLPYSLPILSS
jgi:O-antigen/teichoic acid export membrane protein